LSFAVPPFEFIGATQVQLERIVRIISGGRSIRDAIGLAGAPVLVGFARGSPRAGRACVDAPAVAPGGGIGPWHLQVEH